jgi:predicted nucleic acid-binding protein
VTIYADPSFLISYLYRGDTGHLRARQFFRQRYEETWLTSQWSAFETINSVRQICLQRPGPDRSRVEGLRLLFKRLHKTGPFESLRLDLNDAVIECAIISSAFGTAMRSRSADLLHVALLEQISPDLFVTRDKDQFDLAQARGFRCHLQP